MPFQIQSFNDMIGRRLLVTKIVQFLAEKIVHFSKLIGHVIEFGNDLEQFFDVIASLIWNIAAYISMKQAHGFIFIISLWAVCQVVTQLAVPNADPLVSIVG